MDKSLFYSEGEVRRLKGCLLGFCRERSIKTQEQFYKAIRKARIPYSDCSDREIDETAGNLVELSQMDCANPGSLIYKVTDDADFLSDDPDNLFYHVLHIHKRDDRFYEIHNFIHKKTAFSPVDAF